MNPDQLATGVGRVRGVDAARGLAIVAMLVAHVQPWFIAAEPRPVRLAVGLINNLASPLFGMIMGTSAGLVWQREALVRGDGVGRRLVHDVLRGMVVFGIGMALSALHTWVAVVLQVLGALMVVAAPAALLGTPALTFLTALAFVAAPWVSGVIAPVAVRQFNGAGGFVDQLGQAVYTGASYRAVSLLPFYLAGILVARVVSRPWTGWALIVGGLLAGLAYVGFRAVIGPPTRSGDLLDQFMDVALAFSGYGLVLLLRPGRLTRALARLGTVALTLYVLHVVLLAVAFRLPGTPPILALGALVMVGSLGAGWLWTHYFRRGPVEVAVAALTGRRLSLR